MLPRIITMDQALANGFERRKVYRLVEKGIWVRLHSGVFLTQPDLVENDRWKAHLAGLLIFAGEGAMVSHRSAAILHGLEGVVPWRSAEVKLADVKLADVKPLDVTIPMNAPHRPLGAHRTRFVDPNPSRIDGLTTTSVLRTLHDLAQVCGADVVEQALESALRGPDRRKPDQWNEPLLAELRRSVIEHSRRPGCYLLRTVLDRRCDANRPTGSFPETLLFQALRDVGLAPIRQVTLRIVDGRGITLDIFFPDLCLLQYRLLIEVDGAEAHTGPGALVRDLRRQNKVLQGFNLRRFPAVDILKDPTKAAAEIKRLTLRSDISGPSWQTTDVKVTYTENEFVVVDLSRDAREEAMQRPLAR